MAESSCRRGCSCSVRAGLEQYVKQARSGVSADEIKRVLQETYGVTGSAQKKFIYNIPNVMRMDRLRFIHIDNIVADRGALRPIMDYIDALLEREGIVTARRVFDDQPISCKLLGISSPVELYSVLKLLCASSYDLPWYPQIIKKGIRQRDTRIGGVTSEIEDYIEQKAGTCSYSELMRHFVDDLGYKKSAVVGISGSPKIAPYTADSVVHMRILGWTGEHQRLLEACATDYLHSRWEAGKPYGRLSMLLENRDLPPLPARLPWTPTLLSHLLRREGGFALLGNAGEAFIGIPNDKGLTDLSDLVYMLVRDMYGGGVMKRTLEEYLRDEGVLKGALRTSAIGPPRLVIQGDVVILGELSGHA